MFYQTDPKYKDIEMGFGTSSLYDVGCYFFSLLNGLSRHGWNYTPEEFNELLKEKKLWVGEFKNYIDVSNVVKILPDIFTSFQSTEPWNDVPSLDYLLQHQFVVVCKVSATPIGGEGTHFVLLTGRDGNIAVIHDPWSNKIERITTRWNKYGNILGIRIFEVKDMPSDATKLTSDQLNTIDVIKSKYNTLPAEDSLKSGNLEGYARAITDEHLLFSTYLSKSKILDGFIEKWAEKLQAKPSLVDVEKEFQNLLTTEDEHIKLIDSCEKLVGQHFETEEALRTAVSAFKKDIDGVSQVTEALIEENELLTAKRALQKFKYVELLKEILIRNKNGIIFLVKKLKLKKKC